MSKPPSVEKLFLNGSAGRLEAMLESPSDASVTGAAVVLHPHPQHGGTMHNKLAHTLARAFVRMGFAVLRINFRGTEGSEGEFDEGIGELDDALVAVTWMREKYPDQPFWLAGFSFGAAISVRAAIAIPPAGLVTVAPAAHRFSDGLEDQPRCPWLIVQGDADELVDIDATIAWVNKLEPGPELLVMPGAEHFFHGRLIDLREAVTEFVIGFQH
jgi:alpha/beta superfamily hydrolase